MIPRKRQTRVTKGRPALFITTIFFLIFLTYYIKRSVERFSIPQDQDFVTKHQSRSSKENAIDLINRGQLHLIDILVQSPSQENNAYSVRAKFCQLDWDLHKNDPAANPMFRDLVKNSRSCKKTGVYVDLFQAVSQARVFDANKLSSTHVMKPTGFVFHESRCGSTLVANILAAFNPKESRVYSESAPPSQAAQLFNMNDLENSIQLLRDVIYMMGRSNDPDERNLFFKIQSINSKKIHVFRKAFPQTPWIFVYREPVQVIMSHLKVAGQSRAVCTRSRRNPASDLKALVKRVSGSDISNMSTEEFCAAHLATLCESALTEIRLSNGKGKAVNYKNLPGQMDELIQGHFLMQDGPLHSSAKTRINNVCKSYSKGRNKSRTWKEDSAQKEQRASAAILAAVARFMQKSFQDLDLIE